MNDSQKSKKQLINELARIRQELATASASKKTHQKVIKESTGSDNIFFKAFLSSSDIFIIANPANGMYIEVNDSFVRHTGYSREELIGHTVGEINLWVYQEEYDKMNRLLTEQGKVVNEEFSFRKKSGEIRRWLCSAEIVNLNGTEWMIAVATDITERKKLEEGNKYHTNLLTNIPDAIVSINTDNNIISWNRAAREIYGWSQEEVIGKNMIDVFSSEYPGSSFEEVRESIRKTGCWRGEAIHKTKDGRKLNVLVSSSLVKDDKGNNNGAVSIYTDITERKILEEELLYQRNFNQSVYDSAQVILLILDPSGRIVSFNPYMEEISGYSLEEVKGKYWFDTFLPEREREKIKQLFERAIDNVKTKGNTNPIVTKDGRKLEIRWYDKTLTDVNGDVVGMLAVGHDITERKQMVEKLQYHANLLRDVSNAVVSTDLEHKIISWNRAAELKYGWQENEVIGRKIVDIIKPEYTNDNIGNIMKILRKEGIWRGEAIHKTKEGKLLNVLVSTSLIKDENDNIKGAVAIFNDITERKKAEAALRDSEEKFARAFHTSSNIMSITTPDEGRVVEVNEASCRVFGYTREEFIGHNTTELKIWADTEQRNIVVREFKEKGYIHNMEINARTKSGEIFTIVINVDSIILNDQKYLFWVATDITERKQAESELREAENKYRIVADNTHDWEWWLSPAGKFIYTSPSCSHITGYNTYDFMDDAGLFRSIIHPADLPVWDNHRCETIQGKTSPAIEFRILHKNGSALWIEHICQPVFDDTGKFQGSRGSNRDITERKQAEEALRLSSIQWQSTFDAIGDATCVLDVEGKIQLCNGAMSRLSSKPISDMIGHLCCQVIHGTDSPIEKCPWTAMLKSKSREMAELQIGDKWFEVVVDPILDSHQEVVGAVHIASDVTGRKQVEDALRISEERFRLIADNATDLISRIQMLPEIRTDYVSPSCRRITGYKQEDFYQDPNLGLQMIHPEDREFFLEHINTGDKNSKPITVRLVRKDGQVIWIEQTHTSISNDKGEIVAKHLIARDITERKRAEEALRESEAQLKGILKAAPIGIALVQDHAALWVNDYFCSMTGYSAEELVGVNSRKFYTSYEEYLRVGELKTRNIEFYGKGEVETQFVRKNGQIIDILLIATPLDPDDLSAGVIATIMDITERKQAEKQERETKSLRELDKLRAELLANVSHELRTPLASIKGFTTVLTDYDSKLKPEEKREYLEIIDHNTDRLSELIEQLLVMSRLGAGMLTIDRSPSDIKTLCREVISEARVRAPEFNFTLNLPAKLPRVYIDAKRIRQVLDNLIDNAVKHSFPGTEISITVRRVSNEIVVTVTDEGAGISRKDKPYVFDRMFRADRKHKTGVTGAGLGLSICKGLIEAHQGRIWIDSEEGRGTRCFFTLPTYNNRGVRHGKKDKEQYRSVY